VDSSAAGKAGAISAAEQGDSASADEAAEADDDSTFAEIGAGQEDAAASG